MKEKIFMKKIRFGAFETNSSSAHSIVKTGNGGRKLSYEEIFESIGAIEKPNGNYYRYVFADEITFGRTFNFLESFFDKFCYCMVACQYKSDKLKELFEVFERLVAPKVVQLQFPPEKGNIPFLGIIEGQSIGVLPHFLEANNISFEEFLTNTSYAVVIDEEDVDIWGHIQAWEQGEEYEKWRKTVPYVQIDAL